MFSDWKTYLALALTLLPLLRFAPIVGPLLAVFLKTQLGRAVAGALIIVAAGLWLAAYYQGVGERRGVQKEQDRIEQQNKKAEDAADAAALTVEECYDKGFEWDQASGKCRGKQ
jgi:uncharacterized protein HemX